ncbi:hypothetical protein CANINC_004547 [Pichia inconspicua]|uniref:Oligomycin resistance ATP-dependent permease YOR1 n=1 Tax=Pichia inconspicua TaxID=52247 RepID=A0A4V6TTP4_9ASCO|nr:hypothetical protein CANINC_004547 [[Candida] inconspicua]
MRYRIEKELLSLKTTSSICYDDEDVEKRVARDDRIKPQKRLLTPFFKKQIPPIPNDEERIPFAYTKNNLLSETFFTWCFPLVKVGYLRTLVKEDLYKITNGSEFDVKVDVDATFEELQSRMRKYESKWLAKNGIEDTQENRDALKSDPNFHYPNNLLLLSVFHSLGWNFVITILFKALSDIAIALNTLLIRALILFIRSRDAGTISSGKGYGYAIGISLLGLFNGILGAHAFNRAGIVGATIKGVLTKMCLEKSLRLSRKSHSEYPNSYISSLVGNDVFKIDLAVTYLPFAICLPIGLTIAIVLIGVNLGGASLAGIGYFLLATFIFSIILKKLLAWRKLVNVHTDSRVRYIKEILNNMKMIKYYAWEIPFLKMVKNARKNEMDIMLKMQVARNVVTAGAVTLPLVSAMVAFLAMYGQYGGLKNAADIFSSLTLFNILTLHISLFPLAVSSSGDAWIAFKRIQNFLLAEEEKPDSGYHLIPYNNNKSAIKIENGEFTWEFDVDEESESSDDEKSYFGLHEINMEIQHGEFVVITGSIGSGKSSLLAALTNVMTRISGTIDISGSLILCSDPWIQNTSVKNNILFGLKFDEGLYKRVVNCCCLETDFQLLPARDLTEIGERGVNLSGGQKARINLARAVYRCLFMNDTYNIVLFDDVLSAVDAKVGKYIMEECFLGELKGKTRVLATHQLSLVDEADKIVFMNGDGSIDVGTREELCLRNHSFNNLMEFQNGKEGDKEEEEDDKDEDEEDAEVKEKELKLIKKQTTKLDNDGKLIVAETVKENSISSKMFIEYLKSGCGKFGIKFMVGNVILGIMLTTFCMLFENVWLSFWSSIKFERPDKFYIGIYVLITMMFVICAMWEFCVIVYIANRASTILNIKCIERIMFSPMSFFDTTPLGRIINRFTKDTDVLDNEIAEQARLTCMALGNVIGVLILAIIYLPWFAILIPFLIIAIISQFSLYQASSREVKRIEGVARSFVFSTFEETLQGMSTIRAFCAVKQFIDDNAKRINEMNEAYFLSICLMRWFSIVLHVCSSIINLLITILCASGVTSISSASAGLVISYTVHLSLQIVTGTRALGQVEQLMSSVERVGEYATELPQEKSYFEPKAPQNWPIKGSVKFENVWMRYRTGLPHVLKNLSVNFKGGEKIGVCGRTGAGKSSIITGLYRLSELDSGLIEIDGIDVSKIGLFELRSKLSIIPQDPIVFRGTIRRNLDPFGEVSDEILNEAIKIAVPDEKVRINKFSLDGLVEDGGSNFSLGERQIIALCRAMVKDSKILILDEATSSVDYETDCRIQSVINDKFNECTVICIAHRLKTIIGYDKVLVMDAGEAVEFDSPLELWKKGGIFRGMCDKSGITEGDF